MTGVEKGRNKRNSEPSRSGLKEKLSINGVVFHT